MTMMPTLLDNLLSLEREIGQVFGGFPVSQFLAHGQDFPSVDVADYPNETVLMVAVPGLTREDLKINMDKDVLTISGERKKHAVPEGASWIRNESWEGPFSRSVRLPRKVKTDAISAELTNGILRVVLPKAEEARPREIAIR